MTAVSHGSFLVVVVPVLGAAGGWLLLGQPHKLRIWVLMVTMLTLSAIGWAAGPKFGRADNLPLLVLLPIVTFVSLLGQPLHRAHGSAWLLTVVWLGLGLGALALAAPWSSLCLLLLLTGLGVMLSRSRPTTETRFTWPLATAAAGAVAAAVSLVAVPPVSSLAFALSCAIMLPLFPLHNAYLAGLTTLPGNLPAFLASLLPLVGFGGLLTVFANLPPAFLDAAGMLGLAGSLYGSLKALAQARAASVVAYGSLGLFSILWWYLSVTRAASPHTVIFVSALGLVTSGLLLVVFVLRVRYGEVERRGLSRLAEPMPRFAVLFVLLALAALGFPPFGLFAGFLGMLLSPSFTWSGGVLIVIVAWLTASWYLFDLAQGLLFGRPHAVRRHHEDLHAPEFAALTIVLVLLVALGILPSGFFDVGPPPSVPHMVVMELPR